MYDQALLILSFLSFTRAAFVDRNAAAICEPFYTDFTSSSSVSSSSAGPTAPFVALSPPGSYKTTDGGLELFLKRPEGTITRKGNTNDKIAEGATLNSTFLLRYGRITYDVMAPPYPGVVTAVIVIGDPSYDEIDVELLGGDPKHWQTNVFGPSRQDPNPRYGRFNKIQRFPRSDTIEAKHSYTIDWNRDRIVWSLDGKVERTLERTDTMIEDIPHFPSHISRLQLGIWDASSRAGTSRWARGPIDWSQTPQQIAAVIRSVTVECPHS